MAERTTTPWGQGLWWCAFAAAALRLILVFIAMPAQPGEMAAYGLMAHAIREGKDWPIFLWECHYTGTLTSYLAVPLFAVFGMSMMTLGLATVPWSVAQVIIGYGVAARLTHPRVARLTAWMLAVGPAFFLSYSTMGAFAEGLALGWAALWAALWAIQTPRDALTARRWWWCGLVSGLSLWAQPIALSSVLTIVVWLMARSRPRAHGTRRMFFGGLIMGLVPPIMHNIRYPLASFLRIGGRILRVDRAAWSQSDEPLQLVAQHAAQLVRDMLHGCMTVWRSLQDFLSAGSFPWTWYTTIGALIVLGWILATVQLLRDRARVLTSPHRFFVMALIGWTLAIYLANRNFEGRFWLPLYLPLSLGVAAWVASSWTRPQGRRLVSGVLLTVLLSWNLGSVALLAAHRHRDYRPMSQYLLAHNIQTGYATYAVGYPVMVEAESRVVLSPTAVSAYATDRTPAWTAQVRQAPDAVYVVPRNSTTDHVLANRLRTLNVLYTRVPVGALVAYTQLSRHVRPEELLLPFPDGEDL